MAKLNELTSDNNPYDKDGAIDWLLQTLIKHGGQVNLYPLHGKNSPKSNDIIWAQDLLASQVYIRRVPNAIGVTFAINPEGEKYFYKRVYDKVVATLAKANDFTKVSSILTDIRIEDEDDELSDAIEAKLIKEDKVFATEESGIMLKPTAKHELLHSKFPFDDKKEAQKSGDTFHIPNAIIGNLNTGTVSGNQSSEMLQDSPRMQGTKNNNADKPKIRSLIEMLSWILGIVAALLAIYEFVLKHIFNTPSLFN